MYCSCDNYVIQRITNGCTRGYLASGKFTIKLHCAHSPQHLPKLSLVAQHVANKTASLFTTHAPCDFLFSLGNPDRYKNF
jgi:hypothetical protein